MSAEGVSVVAAGADLEPFMSLAGVDTSTVTGPTVFKVSVGESGDGIERLLLKDLRGERGILEVMLADVADMKLVFAAFRKEVGKARSIFWEYGTAPEGRGSRCELIVDN